MKKTFSRFLSALLTFVLILGMLPQNANAVTGYDRGYTGAMAGDGVIYAHGLDVSSWQGESLDFQNFKNAGYSYVILRCGTTKGKDTCFETYYAKAKAAGLDVGAYYYSYATSVAEAQTDATNMLRWMGHKKFEYPIYFDFEDPDAQAGLSDTTCANICYAFMDMVKDAGYLVGLYSMASWIEKSWVTTSGIRDKYEGWVAHYPSTSSNTGKNSGVYNKYNSTYNTRYGMYQYSYTTYVNGAGPFDANISYKDYPSIVKYYGFNGYTPSNTHTISFDSNGGSSVSSVYVEDGATLSAPPPPTRYGFNFAGWYCNPELTDLYDFSTPVPYSFVLFAKWEEAYWGAYTDLMPVDGKLVLNDFQGTGQYIWPYYNDDGSVTLYNGATNDANWTWPSAYMDYENSFDSGNDAYLYVRYSATAQFNATIDYLDADGNTQSVMLSQLAGNGSTDLPAGNHTLTLNLGQYIYDQGHLSTSDGSIHSRNVKFTKVTYYIVGALDSYVRLYDMQLTYCNTVFFDSNQGSATGPVELAHGAALTAPAAPTRLGFDFAGWYVDENLTSTYDFTQPVLSDLTLYAKWTPAKWPLIGSMLPVSGQLGYNDFQGTGESVWDYYNDDGSVTLYNAVDGVDYSWPSGYMVYENAVDLTSTPYLHLNFRCDSAFNCEITCLDDNGESYCINLSGVAGLTTVDFEAGTYDLYLNFASYLETQGIFPDSGSFKITKVTYYVVGAKDTYARLYDLAFTAESGEEDTVTIPTLTLSYPTLNFKDVVYYNVYYQVSDMTDVVEMGLITFDGALSTGTIDDATAVISGYVASGSNYMVHTNGIHAKNLGDALYFKVYAKLSDGSYVYSSLAGYHAVAYAKDILANSTNAKMKSLVVAMLNYGAAAQVQFEYKTDSLMNSFLTEEQKALVAEYSADMVAPVTKVDSSKIGSFGYVAGGYSALYPSVSFEGAFSVKFYFTPAKAMDGDLTMYYWSAADYAAADVLTAENATGVFTMDAISGTYVATVEGIAARQIDETIYVAGIYESNGVSYPTGVIAYSLGTYCLDRVANGTGNMPAFAKATIVYGNYAKAYFA